MAGRYLEIAHIAPYRVVRDTQSAAKNQHYAAWYDAEARQTRRRALGTTSGAQACTIVQGLVDRGIVGDPKDALNQKPLQTVSELLDAHAPYIETLASAEAGRAQVKRLKRLLGDKRLAQLVRRDFEAFRDAALKEGIALSTVDRTLGTLIKAANIAVDNKLLRPGTLTRIPKFFTKNHARSASPKGRLLDLDEIAKLIDAITDVHLMFFIVLLINTASRPGALLELSADQIKLGNERIELNPEGRIQTIKWRPILPIPATLLPWVTNLPPGRLITYRRQPIMEIDTAFITAACRAGLPGRERPYSLRHVIARYMRQTQVPIPEIAVWLGHIQPPENPQITLIYSPDSPDYLMNAKTAVESFVTELNKLTARDLLIPPWQ